jgi:capsid protein
VERLALAPSWLDRALSTIAPQWQLKRTKARIATELVLRHYGYEAAAVGRRTSGWNRSAGDANTVNGFASLQRVREVSRDLVRNNPYAASALATIADHTVGWGIVAKPIGREESAPPRGVEGVGGVDRLRRRWAARPVRPPEAGDEGGR